MGFFDTFGLPKSLKTSTKSKTTKNLIKEAISLQRKLLEGKPVTKGKSKVKSWFNGEKFTPKAGQFSLFDKEYVDVGTTDRYEVLDIFEKALDQGELNKYISSVEFRKKAKVTTKL